eukprot:GEMP01028850.1.p1 GENE.GEMP01028850.1~~GEMP01028850.1.p1  ORF type:complete len:345 (+),score=62.05 GEMP01028850.1:112-1146(+)
MSFRDFDPSTRLRQPKQKHQEDGCYEKQIKNLIQKLQAENRAIKEDLSRSKSCKRKIAVLEEFIHRTHGLAQSTEALFRDWQVFLAGEPHERHRKKFSIEKLRRAFDDEVRHLKDLASTTLLLQEELIKQPEPEAVEIQNVCDDDMDEEAGLLSSQLESRMLEDRTMGIRRIQGQVSDVNQIFKDLASIVQDQGEVLDSIENEASASAEQTKRGVQEIKKAHDRQRASRERVCCLLMMVVLFFTILAITHHGWSRPGIFSSNAVASAPAGTVNAVKDGANEVNHDANAKAHTAINRGVQRDDSIPKVAQGRRRLDHTPTIGERDGSSGDQRGAPLRRLRGLAIG